MNSQTTTIENLHTNRLLLIPFTTQICKNLLNNDFSDMLALGLQKGASWPDEDVIETLPKILNNLSTLALPTGFESWMIVKKDSTEIIGDIGFKGFNKPLENIDLGYGIIKEERRKGFALEAATALIKWAFATSIVKEITASCLLHNIGSVNLLQKLDFKETMRNDEMIYWALKNDKQC